MADIHMARSFVDALAHLDAADARRTAIFLDRLIEDPARTSFNFEQINEARDPKMRSARASRDLRVIIHVDGPVLLLVYVDHHDIAYAWARTKCVECHVVTGALQVVESPEVGRARISADQPDRARSGAVRAAFDDASDEYLLSLGVPPDWLPVLREVRSEAQFWSIAEDLPEAVGERLLKVMVGELVEPPIPLIADVSPLSGPDTRRWICTVSDDGGLCQLLDPPDRDRET